MRQYKTVQSSYKECPFTLLWPKVTVADSSVHIEFLVSFLKKTQPVKYIIKACMLMDKYNHKSVAFFDDKTNFSKNTKQKLVVDAKNIYKNAFTIVIRIMLITGECVDITYCYENNRPILLKTIATADMTEEEKSLFLSVLSSCIESQENFEEELNDHIESTSAPDDCSFKDFIDAISSELHYLKNHGGKRYKVTEGRLLGSKMEEFSYSFELETELFLSDDAPIAIIRGIETVKGNVIVCDGLQIIVSLEKSIGDFVQSAYISAEPWKLLERLQERIKMITPEDKFAWQLFHTGPVLTEKHSDILTIKKGQSEAIAHAIDEDITLIWGPPGTGKTYTMAQVTKQFVSMGKTVLIVSHSNISVDNVVKQIAKQFEEQGLQSFLLKGAVLRYGYVRDEELSKNENCVAFRYALNTTPELKEPYNELTKESKALRRSLQYKYDIKIAERRKDIEKQLKRIRANLQNQSKELVSKAQVVATTVSKIYMDLLFENKKYDVVMFDEVSMAYVPQLLCAATFAKEKFICVGDFRQLSSIAQSDKAKSILQRDIFSFLNISRGYAIHNHPWLVMLDEQRRMHPSISLFSSKKIYNGLLKDHPSVWSKWNDIVTSAPLSANAMNLIDIGGTYCAASKANNSHFNILSALLSFGIALSTMEQQNDLNFKNEEKVGIVSPYAAQVRLIKSFLQDCRDFKIDAISCATVHQFQGSERNTIIFDIVESYPFAQAGWLVSKSENNSVLRLINVALTRARGKFVTLANTRFWHTKFQGTQNTYYTLLKHIEQHEHTVCAKDNSLVELVKDLNFGPNIELFINEMAALELLLKDIGAARDKIVITLPSDKLNSQYEFIILKAIQEQGVTALGKAKTTTNLNEEWKDLVYESNDAVFPLIVIDDQVTWYGFPLTELIFEDKNYRFLTLKNLIFRITGKHTNEMISSLCNLTNRVDDKNGVCKLQEKCSAKKSLSVFISETESCKKCGKPMRMSRIPGGKFNLICSACKSTGFLSVYTLNRYFDAVNAKCPACGRDVYAEANQYGVHAKCCGGHYTKVSDFL